MHKVVSYGYLIDFFVENSEKTRAAGCSMIIQQMSIRLILMLLRKMVLEVVWLSCKLKSPR